MRITYLIISFKGWDVARTKKNLRVSELGRRRWFSETASHERRTSTYHSSWGDKKVGGVQDYTGQKIVVIYIVLPAEGNINTLAF